MALLWLPPSSWRAWGSWADIRARLREKREVARGEGGDGQSSGRASRETDERRTCTGGAKAGQRFGLALEDVGPV